MQQHQLDEKTRLLNISYLKLQQVKFNKLTKRAVETPLNQSVIVWNFLKKVENLIYENHQQQQQQMMIINNETTSNPNIDWATITPPPPQPHHHHHQENVNTTQLMDIDINVNNNNSTSSSSNSINKNNKTTAIGSERKNKLLNKNQNENEPPTIGIEQDQQLTVLFKRSKFSTDDLIVSSQPIEDVNEEVVEDEEEEVEASIMMDEDDNNTFSLWSTSSSSIQQQHQQQQQQDEYNYYYYYYQQQQQQKSCSYEFIDQQLDSNIEYFDDNVIDQSSMNNNTQSSQTANIEQVINILIECE